MKLAATFSAVSLAVLLLAGCGDRVQEEPEPEPEIPRAAVGVHYYTWYDEQNHWEKGVAHEPFLGFYNSGDRAIAEQQIEWMTAAGIDVAAVEWSSPWIPEAHFRDGFLRASNLNKLRWCFFYDTIQRFQQFGDFSPDRIDFSDPSFGKLLVDDITRLAREFFGHPQYYRIDGRPVIWIYLTRSFAGNWRATLAELRRRTAELGTPIYIIADEVWYTDPEPSRLESFDAVSSYFLYDSDRMGGQASWSLTEMADIFFPAYERWQAEAPLVRNRMSGRPVAFMPAVVPQFDDRAVRGNLHPPVLAQSRQEIVDILLRAKHLAALNADPQERIVWITSFNEWHEGTALEPTIEEGPAFPGGNYGFELLQAVSEAFASRP